MTILKIGNGQKLALWPVSKNDAFGQSKHHLKILHYGRSGTERRDPKKFEAISTFLARVFKVAGRPAGHSHFSTYMVNMSDRAHAIMLDTKSYNYNTPVTQ